MLGGTFNPPHIGHLALARAALSELDLDRVVLMPAHTAPHKAGGAADPGPHHRLEMCRLLTAGDARLSVSSLEVDRGGPSYTVDTLEHINASDPSVQLTFIVGADTAATLPGWHRPARLLELACLGLAARAGASSARALDAVGGIGGEAAAERVRTLRMPEVAVSSSLVRERIARGEPVQELVGAEVGSYIASEQLYRTLAEVRG